MQPPTTVVHPAAGCSAPPAEAPILLANFWSISQNHLNCHSLPGCPVSTPPRQLRPGPCRNLAYYVFVRSLVLGEQVKEHRRRVLVVGNGREGVMVRSRHILVWDIVFSLVKYGKGAGGGEEGQRQNAKRKRRRIRWIPEVEAEAEAEAEAEVEAHCWAAEVTSIQSSSAWPMFKNRTQWPNIVGWCNNAQQLHKYKSTLYAYLIATQGVSRKMNGDTLIHQIST